MLFSNSISFVTAALGFTFYFIFLITQFTAEIPRPSTTTSAYDFVDYEWPKRGELTKKNHAIFDLLIQKSMLKQCYKLVAPRE